MTTFSNSFKKNFSVFFNKYKPIFDQISSENGVIYDSDCTTRFSDYSRNINSFKSDCIKCMNYLKYLDDVNDQEYHERGIIYLYLWLYYYEVRNKINGENTLENMKKLMNLFETHHNLERNIHNVYNNHIERVLNNELNDLFYLYEKFDNFKKKKNCLDNICKCGQDCIQRYKSSIEKCGSNSNMYFCNELENFRNQYNEYRLTEKDCPEVDLYLPPFKKYSTSVIILISFFTISVLSSFLFILYKFTPFRSRFRFRSKRPQRIYSNFTNEEANLLYTKERSKTQELKPYNIAYNTI